MTSSTNASKAFDSALAAERVIDLSNVVAPLVIGITGHRDIRSQDRDELESAVRSIFVELRTRYRSTPFMLLSALAEGADRLAARVALSEGIRLFVPLPMKQAIYEGDFDADFLADFRDLLSRAEGSLELPLVPGNSEESIQSNGPQRDLQYESVGKYIVQKSQILIALWDGVTTGLVGGTSSIVRFQNEGLPPSEPCCLDPQEGFPVYHIVTPHEKNPSPEGVPFQRIVLYPNSFRGDEKKAERYYDRMFLRIDAFNEAATHSDSGLVEEISNSKGYVLKDLKEDQFSEQLRAELNRYGLADALALRFQTQKVWTERVMHGIVFFAFFLFVSFAHHLFEDPLFLMLSLVLVLLGSVWQYLFRKRDGDTRVEDYRAMAEGLRVRFFWRLVGVSDSVTDHYLGKQRSELDWIRNGFRGWDVHSDSASTDPAQDVAGRIEKAQKYWIRDQQKYFHDSSERDEKRLEWIEIGGQVLVFIALITGATLLALAFRPSWQTPLHCEAFTFSKFECRDLLIVLVESALAAAALLHNYGNVMAYREHAKQYKRMEAVFSQAFSVLPTIADPGVARQCIKKLGMEALRESGDWVLLHRERPLDVPHP